MWEELFFHVRRGQLPPGPSFYYDDRDPLGWLSHALAASPELDGPLPAPAGATWRQRWLEALERHWPLDDDERRLHLAALESRLLARLRELPADAAAARRIGAFLRSLGPPCSGPPWHDGLLRWVPGDGSAEDWFAEALRLSAEASAGGASYEVLFPGTWGNQAGLIRARLTRLRAPVEQPRVLLAAWSHYLLTEADAGQLVGQFDELARRHPDRLGDDRFLLELLPLSEPGFSPPTVAVEGQSLGLAVLLAAWAAGARPSLTPLIATGRLLGGEVRSVGSVFAKSEVVRRFLERGRPNRFLVPQENRPEVRAELDEQFPGRTQAVARDVNALFARTDLLTDGCDGYRALLAANAAEWTTFPPLPPGTADAFGQYEPHDGTWLAEVAARLAPGSLAATALPFGNDPRRAMRFVLGVVRRLIALPLWLADDAPAETAVARLLWRVRRGLADVGEPQPVSDEAIRNLIGTFGGLLVLVAYGSPSTALVPHAADAARWRQVCDDVGALPRRPGVLLLASDLHHLDRLCPEGGGVTRWVPGGARSASEDLS